MKRKPLTPIYVRLSRARVEEAMVRRGIGAEELKRRADIKHETWQRIREEKNIWLSTAKRVADKLTDGDLMRLYHSSVVAHLAADQGAAAIAPGLPDWEPVEPLSGCESAANGLQYYLWKLKHRFEDERLARGKRYDLALLPTAEQDRLQHYLTRHGNVCNRIAKHPLIQRHPRFLQHFTTTPDPQGKGWWVVDEWVEGRTLEKMLKREKEEKVDFPRVFREIAEGIQVLHDAEIIRRELSPRFVLLEKQTNAVYLTEFELGKLFDGAPTARGEASYNPYRAEEAGGELRFADRHVDFYSWGRMLVEAVAGYLPKKGEERAALEKVKLPAKVREIALRSVSRNGAERPQNVGEIEKALRAWK